MSKRVNISGNVPAPQEGVPDRILKTPVEQIQEDTLPVGGAFLQQVEGMFDGMELEQPTPDQEQAARAEAARLKRDEMQRANQEASMRVENQRQRMMQRVAEDPYMTEQQRLERGLEVDQTFERSRIEPLQLDTQNLTDQQPTWNLFQVEKDNISGDGGVESRMNRVAEAVISGERSSVAKGSNFGKIAVALGAANYNILQQGSASALQINPEFGQVIGAVTENYFANRLAGRSEEDILSGVELPKGPSEIVEQGASEEVSQQVETIRRSDDATMLGQEIGREFQRINNMKKGLPTDQTFDLSPEDAAVLGVFGKEMFAAAMPDNMLQKIKDSGGRDVYVFNPSPSFVEQILSPEAVATRKLMFPKKIIRTQLAPTRGKSVGEISQYTKNVSGKKPKGSVTSKEQEEARENLGKVAHKVLPQRLKILLSTILPALNHNPQNYGRDPLLDTFATINNFGLDKLTEYRAKQNNEPEGSNYNAFQEIGKLKRVISQHVYGISQERKQANYLTYFFQSFNGRLTPNQTHFNPTTSKAVRFVTGSVKPTTIKKGGRFYETALQAYALVLGISPTRDPNGKFPSIDQFIPSVRKQQLLAGASKYEAWGDRLSQVLDNTMTDEEVEVISEAIAAGIPMTDPSFPQVKQMQLDPNVDQELIEAIRSKGEDGLSFIDGLIDFSKFQKAMRSDNPVYRSYINPVIDGKTNGPAINGVMMGDEHIALMVGAYRSKDQVYAVEDDMDMRDILESNLNATLNEKLQGRQESASLANIRIIAKGLFGYRTLNKAMVMTFGYGKEIESFKPDIVGAMQFLAEKGKTSSNPSDVAFTEAYEYFVTNPQKLENLQDSLMRLYLPAVEQLMGSKGIESRKLMRSVAFANALYDEPLVLEGPVGNKLFFGGLVEDPSMTERVGSFKVDGRTVGVDRFGKKPTSAAARVRVDPTTNVPSVDVGGWAWGGVIPGPVQAVDAATVVKSVTGNSWKKMSFDSSGTPYVHQIYDAFKFDIASFHSGLEEVNTNWAKISLEWSYLQAAKEAQITSNKNFKKKLREAPRNPDGTINLSDFPMVAAFLDKESGVSLLGSKLKNLTDIKFDTKDEGLKWQAGVASKLIRNSGIPVGSTTAKPEQVEKLIQSIFYELNTSSRLNKLISIVERDKKELAKILLDPNNRIYQYYSH
jgi:hypothetical protein